MWLEEVLATTAGKPIALIIHKPMTALDDELAAAPWQRFVPFGACRRLTELIDHLRVPVVVSGHLHQFRVLSIGRRHHVWAPTTWAVLPSSKVSSSRWMLRAEVARLEGLQPSYEMKRSGVVEMILSRGGAFAASLVEPPGLAQLTLIEDLPDPYRR